VAICLRLFFITIYGENDFKSLRYNLKETVMYISHCRAQKSVNEVLKVNWLSCSVARYRTCKMLQVI